MIAVPAMNQGSIGHTRPARGQVYCGSWLRDNALEGCRPALGRADALSCDRFEHIFLILMLRQACCAHGHRQGIKIVQPA
jgi:hypothetical protein